MSLNYFCEFTQPLGEDFSDLSTDMIKTAYRSTVRYVGYLLFVYSVTSLVLAVAVAEDPRPVGV